MQIRAAAPIPTHNGGDSVPLRRPLSCPPPEKRGSSLTLGRLLMYSAPMPFGP